MSIRVIDSCAGSRLMCTAKGAETRILSDNSIKWKEVSKYCIDNKKYLIVTPCVNDGNNKAVIPSDAQWVKTITDACEYLISIRGNRYNARFSLINEPMKFITKEQYAHFIGLAYPIIHSSGFLCSVGNEEFFTAQARGFMYQYILNERMAGRIKFDILDVHIQGSCGTIELLDMWINEVLGWMDYWKIEVDCTEAFYGKIQTSSGYNLLLAQLDRAENKLHCKNFGNVFNNLDTSVFPILSDPKVRDRWYELCFNINSSPHSNYWTDWKGVMNSKGPIPNIEEVFEMYGIEINYVKPGSHNEETRAVQQVMLDEGYDLSPFGADSWYGTITEDAIKKWQEDNDLTVDGVVGKNTWQWIFENIDTGMLRFLQMIVRTGRYK